MAGQDGSYSLSTTHLITSGISAGSPYKFRVRAHNVHGWGDKSSEVIIYATDAPSQPQPVTTTAASASILIRWTAPNSNYESIDAYKLLI